MKAAAFAPAHITGFFALHPDTDPTRAGSVGCGVCLEAGVRAEVTVDEGADTSRIILNGNPVDVPAVEYVIERLAGSDASGVLVELESEVPLGYGFGVSGAAALAVGLAVNEAAGLGLSQKDVAGAAHIAEVVNRTGMGDVAGQCAGGLALRKRAGAPGVGIVEKIPVETIDVSWVCLGGISTASVLEDEKTVAMVNKLGGLTLKSFIEHPGLENFMVLSRDFAIATELISSRALDAVEAVEALGGRASMAMLGDTVFTLGDGDALSEFGAVGHSRIVLSGAHNL